MQCRFDRFVLDTEQLYLTADGAPLDADARQLQLLGLLCSRYPEPCSQAELLEELWPGAVVSHWSAGRLVSDTRKFFRAHGYDGPLIQTLHGRGYRLAPELADMPAAEVPPETAVEEVPAAVTETQPSSATFFPSRAASLKHWLPPLALFLCVAGAAWLLADTQQRADSGLTIGEAPDTVGRILWVDDNPDNNLAERTHFEANRIAVYCVTNTEDALTLLSMYNYDVVISDMGRGEESLAGFKLVAQMRDNGDQTPFYLYTILPSDAQRLQLTQRGGQGIATTAKGLYGLILPLFTAESASSNDS